MVENARCPNALLIIVSPIPTGESLNLAYDKCFPYGLSSLQPCVYLCIGA